MADKYCIYIVSPPGYIHSHTFDEAALALQEGFRDLGYDAPIVHKAEDIVGRAVVFGAHLLPPWLPDDAIIYNTEQIDSGWMNEDYLRLTSERMVWTATVGTNPPDSWNLCLPGYARTLERLIASDKPHIDVLFYGSIYGRRIPILDAIKATGLNVVTVFGKYSNERDKLIARSKIVLNLHAFETSSFEWVRVSYLLNNKIFVISEHSNEEPEGVVFGTAAELPELCRYYATHDDKRRALAELGHAKFKAIPQAQYLREVLTRSLPSGQ